MKLYQIFLFNFLVCFSIISRSTDIFRAIEMNDKKVVSQWLKSTDDVNAVNEEGETPLIAAVKSGSDRLVKQLLKHKSIDVNRIDNVGKTVLDYAVEYNYKSTVLSLIKKHAKVTTEDNVRAVKKLTKINRIFVNLLGGFFGFLLGVSAMFTSLILMINGVWAVSGAMFMIISTTVFVIVPATLLFVKERFLYQDFLLTAS